MTKPTQPEFEIYGDRIPHWSLQGSTYFITFRIGSGRLSSEERNIVLNHIKEGDAKFYNLYAASVLPDHVHLLIQPLEGFTLSRIVKGVKGPSAMKVNMIRGAKGKLWQANYFDRIVRNTREFKDKLNYMLMNSVKAGLVNDPWEYDGWYWSGWD